LPTTPEHPDDTCGDGHRAHDNDDGQPNPFSAHVSLTAKLMQINALPSMDCLRDGNPSRKELPMNEDALGRWFWIAVVVLALALWTIPYMVA
jgi:hypothetical protein